MQGCCSEPLVHVAKQQTGYIQCITRHCHRKVFSGVFFFASEKEILSHKPIVFRVMFLLRVMNLCHALPCMETQPVMRENILNWEEWLPAKGNDLDKLEGWATKSS